MNRLLLPGCGSTPLASYLTALGVLRIVAMQKDAGARGRWVGHRFELSTSLDEAGLVAFFTDEYVPTPILAPWNGGSGFYPKDNRVAIEAILNSSAPRLGPYRSALETARDLLARLGIDEKVGKGPAAKSGDTVKVHYTGRLMDGTKFDSSLDRDEPFSFTLGQGQVIKGWDEGVVGMKKGGKRKLVIPSDMAYGKRGSPPKISPDAPLHFEIELLEIGS